MTWFVYILLCDQKTFYVGMTRNIKKRLTEHKNKKSFFTKKFSDIRIVYTEKRGTENEARMREKQLKGWSRLKKKALIIDNKDLLKELSKSIGHGEVLVRTRSLQ